MGSACALACFWRRPRRQNLLFEIAHQKVTCPTFVGRGRPTPHARARVLPIFYCIPPQQVALRESKVLCCPSVQRTLASAGPTNLVYGLAISGGICGNVLISSDRRLNHR